MSNKKKTKHNPAEWAIFLVDDGLDYWEEWGQRGSDGEDGMQHWNTDDRLVMMKDDQDFRTKLVTPAFLQDPMGRRQLYKVYRAHAGDLNAWSWGSLPGKRLDEGVISRLVQGRYAEKELDHLEGDGEGMDFKKIAIIAIAAIAILAVVYFVVLPRFKSSKAPTIPTENKTQQQITTENTTGRWIIGPDNKWTWVANP